MAFDSKNYQFSTSGHESRKVIFVRYYSGDPYRPPIDHCQ